MEHKKNTKQTELNSESSKLKNSEIETLFKGRINRSVFTWSYFMFIIISIVIKFSFTSNDLMVIIILSLVIVFFSASLIVQRLHDLGRPGYHYWLILIPFYNIFFILVELCGKKGEIGENKYGAPQKN
jgi:uncharacterized membrane protein YhaH (DUF805 family)